MDIHRGPCHRSSHGRTSFVWGQPEPLSGQSNPRKMRPRSGLQRQRESSSIGSSASAEGVAFNPRRPPRAASPSPPESRPALRCRSPPRRGMAAARSASLASLGLALTAAEDPREDAGVLAYLPSWSLRNQHIGAMRRQVLLARRLGAASTTACATPHLPAAGCARQSLRRSSERPRRCWMTSSSWLENLASCSYG